MLCEIIVSNLGDILVLTAVQGTEIVFRTRTSIKTVFFF